MYASSANIVESTSKGIGASLGGHFSLSYKNATLMQYFLQRLRTF